MGARDWVKQTLEKEFKETLKNNNTSVMSMTGTTYVKISINKILNIVKQFTLFHFIPISCFLTLNSGIQLLTAN